MLVVGAPVDRADVIARCERLVELMRRSDADVVVCDVAALDAPDAATIDALCLLLLSVRRVGARSWVRGIGRELGDLLCLFGLCEARPCADVSAGQPVGEPEEGEEALGIQEERDAFDPPA
jgi:hypothetical protein